MELKITTEDIQKLLEKVKIFNREIGNYKMHVMNDNFDYAIMLDNGRLILKLDELISDRNGTISPESLKSISNRFQNQQGDRKIDGPEQQRGTDNTTVKNDTQKITKPVIVPAEKSSMTWIWVILSIAVVLLIIFIYNNSSGYEAPPQQPSNQNQNFNQEVQQPSNQVTKSNEEINESELYENNGGNQKTEEQLRQDLFQTESSNPSDYIKVSYNWKVNLAANTILEGYIKNAATVAGFKNVTIRAKFFSKTGTLLGQDVFTVMEFVKPRGSIPFRHKIVGFWKDAKESRWELVSAQPY